MAVAILALGGAAHAGNTWDGGGGDNNWTTPANWSGDSLPTYGTLTFSGSTRPNNTNNNASLNMNQINFNSSTAFTIGGNAISLFDNGGTQAKIENNGSALATVNLATTFAATTGTARGEINAVNGDLTFGSGATINVTGSAVNGIALFGSGRTVTFNNTISAGSKWFGFTTGGSGNTFVINGTVTSGDWYVQNNGTLNIGSTGNMNAAGAIRIGGDFGNTGFLNVAGSGTVQLTNSTGGQTLSNTINTVAGNTSGNLNVNSLNGSGTNNITGGIFLDSNLKISQSSGGTLNISSGTFNIKDKTITFLGAGGSINVSSVISNSPVGGQIVVGTNGVANTGGTVTLSNTNTYSGETFVRNGTLAYTSTGSTANSTIRLGSTSGTSVDAAVNFVGASGSVNINNTINPVATSGSGTTSLNSLNTSGTNTYAGHFGLDRNLTVTQASGGTLAITQVKGGDNSTGTDIKASTLTFTPAALGTIQHSGTIYNSTGTGAVTMNGAGTLILSGANTYSGATTVRAGTLLLGTNAPSGSAGALGNSTSAVLLGDTSGTANASLLTNGAFTVGRAIEVRSGNTGIMTIGGNTAAASAYSGNITLGTSSGTAKNLTLVAASGGSVEFSGVIDENTSVPASNVTIGTGPFTGTVRLSNTGNGYSGVTTVTNGRILEVTELDSGGNNSSIGNSSGDASNLVLNGGTLRYIGGGLSSTNRLFDFNANGATLDAAADVSFTGTGSLVASGTFGNRTLTLTGASNGSLASIIPDPINSFTTSVTKSGSGTWTLSGASTYTGGTNVVAGTLLVNGNGSTGVGPVTVAGGTLGGTGTITGDVSFTSGTLAPGLSPGSMNAASLSLSNSTYTWEYDSTNTANADVVNLTTNAANVLAINSLVKFSPLDWSGTNTLMAIGTKFVVASYAHALGWNGGLFVTDTITPVAIPDDSYLLLGSQVFLIDYNDPNAQNAVNANLDTKQYGVTLTAVPEASSLVTIGLGGICAFAAIWLSKRLGLAAWQI